LKGLANGEADMINGGIKFQKLISFNKAINHIRFIPQSPPRFDFTVKRFFDQMLIANQDCIGCAETLERVCKAFELDSILQSRMTDISGGQLQRVHLAAALASKAELLLLDEPSAALDRNNVAILMRLLREFIEQRNGYVICCTHDANFRWQCGLEDRWNAFEFPTLSRTF
jgi:ABC-type Mn2+/Zn2+ transport system ATPase subunit